MSQIHHNGQINLEIFSDINNQPIQLTLDENNNEWFATESSILFASQTLTDAEFHINNENELVTANATVGGISLTFEYNSVKNAFESDETINIIHIVADHIHTLTHFSISNKGSISAALMNDQLTDFSGNYIRLTYNEINDSWSSEIINGVKYGLCFFDQAQLFLNDYDFYLKGIARFSDTIIEYCLGKNHQKDIFFFANDVRWTVGEYEFIHAEIRYYASGQLEASGQMNIFDQMVNFSYSNGKMLGHAEIVKKYSTPEKGCFSNYPYYQLNIIHEIEIDIFNTKQANFFSTFKLVNPFVLNNQNMATELPPKTVILTRDSKDNKLKAEILRQTAVYKGLAKNGFLGDYYFEESKKYIYDPDSEILTVGTKFLEGHGKLFYKKVYHYYYKNFEQYSVVKGIWPFRRLEYQYYYQILSHSD